MPHVRLILTIGDVVDCVNNAGFEASQPRVLKPVRQPALRVVMVTKRVR
jgi:hypothetical protein